MGYVQSYARPALVLPQLVQSNNRQRNVGSTILVNTGSFAIVTVY